MRIRVLFLATLLATLAPVAGVRAAEDEATVDVRQAHLFPRPAELEPQIRFWRAIFTQYSAHQVVLHDAVHLDKVYKVLDFRSRLDDGFSEGELASLERLETDVELDRLRALLLRLHAAGSQPESLTAEERAVYDLWADDPAPDRFLTAADDKRLHSQRGLRERFAEGVRASRAYFPEMEHIFREEGLPVELVRLPLIESCFNLRAYSKAGAAGVWQFMPKTGRLFMRVHNRLDARRARIGRSELASLNPALSTLVVTGRRPIPAGYRLRLPESAGGSFENRLAEFSAEQGVTSSASPRPVRVAASAKGRVRPAVLTYRVRRGATASRTVKKQHKVSASSHRPSKKARHRPRQNLKIRTQSAA